MESAPIFPGIAFVRFGLLGAEYVCPETFLRLPERGLPAAKCVWRAIPVKSGRAAFLYRKHDEFVLAIYECSGDGFRAAAQVQIAAHDAWRQIREAWLHFNGQYLVCRLTSLGTPGHVRTIVFDLGLCIKRDECQVYDSTVDFNTPVGGGGVLENETTMVDAFGQKTQIVVPADVLAGAVRPTLRFLADDSVQDTRLVFRSSSCEDYFVTDGGLVVLDIWKGVTTPWGCVGHNYWHCYEPPNRSHLRKFGDRELIRFILRTNEIWRQIWIRHDLAAAYMVSDDEMASFRRECCAVDLRRAAELELAAARAAVESLPDAEPEPLPRFVLRCFVAEDAAVRAQPRRFGFRPSAWVSLLDDVQVTTTPDEE